VARYRLYVLLFFCVLTLPVFAQPDFYPGYYIPLERDTVKGYLQVPNAKTATTFNFKSSQETGAMPISFDTCELVMVPDLSFSAWHVKRELITIDPFDFSIKYPDSSITATIPLKQLYKGKWLSLYHFRDIKDHFFVLHGGTMDELVMRYRYLTDWEKRVLIDDKLPAYVKMAGYKQQLMMQRDANFSERLVYRIEVSEYDKRSLVALFKVLNESQ
jgi:hypothetical protein